MTSRNQSYRLRPNKHVDRELFAELVSLLITASHPDDYVYISMGGNHLSDHIAIYRRAGLSKLYAFDLNQDVVDRQNFNVPFDGVVCKAHTSGELPTLLDGIVEDFNAKNVIIWLDYSEPKRLEQLREIQAIVEKLQVGDIIRVTMNADFSGLHKREANLLTAEKTLPQSQKKAVLLRGLLGTYMPHSIVSLDFNGMAGALAKSIERACVLGAESNIGDKKPQPVLLTRYQDTTAMLTVTVMMTDMNGVPEIPKGWAYAPTSWDQIEKIQAPDLSARERLALDQLMHKGINEIQNELGFSLDETAVNTYSKFHRFYPAFQTVVD